MTTTRGERSAASRVRGGPVRVWSECSVTVSVTDDPPQFIKFTFGREAFAPTDSNADARAAEKELYEFCEEIVTQRVADLTRVVEGVQAIPAPEPRGAALLRRRRDKT